MTAFTPSIRLPRSTTTLHVALVEPEIHWNTGNAGRTCLAIGARLHLIEPLGFSLDEREVRRAGLDYWAQVEPRTWKSWPAFEAELGGLGSAWFLSAGAERNLWEVDDFGDCPVLIFGKESTGLSPDIRHRYAERLISIPMADPAGVRSLNLSTAVAVAAYEVLRRRREWKE